MKKLLIILIIPCLLLSCGNKKAGGSAQTTEGTKSATEVPVYQLDDLLKVADRLVDQTVTVKGSVLHTCVHSGKRCFLVGEDERVSMRIEAKGKITSFDRELIGSELAVTGVLKERQLSKEYIDQMEKETKEKMIEEDGSAESCQTELDNIKQMRDWMQANDKDHYSVYYMDGEAYETL